jgi:peptidase S24-like protein
MSKTFAPLSSGPNAFGITVEDTACEPELRKGAVVISDPDAPVRPGELVVAVLEREQRAVIRKLRELSPSDREHFDLVANGEPDIHIDPNTNPGFIIGPVTHEVTVWPIPRGSEEAANV